MKHFMKQLNPELFCIAVFIAFPLILLAAVLLKPDNAVSVNENRMLTTVRDIPTDVLDGQFQEGLENYLSDQFPFRERLKSAETGVRLRFGQASIGGAYVGRDRRLFQKLPGSDVDSGKCVRYAARVNRMAEQTGIPTYVMYVPSAGIALREEMPFGAPMYDYDALYAALAEELPSVHMIDLLPALYGHSEYYYATDHHWTAEGAAQAYYEWRAAHGAEPDNQDSPTIITVSDSFRGTLWSRVPSGLIPAERLKAFEVSGDITVEADGKEISLFDETALATKDKYNFFEGGNHGILTVTNHDVKDGGTLLILKDSFANSFLPCLVGDYARIIMIDERYAFMDIGQFALDSGVDEIAVIREIISAG